MNIFDKFWFMQEAKGTVSMKFKKDKSKRVSKKNTGEEEVKAHVEGEWAAHPPLGATVAGRKKVWHISHQASGLRVPGVEFKTARDAKKAIKELSELAPKWNGKGQPDKEFLEAVKNWAHGQK